MAMLRCSKLKIKNFVFEQLIQRYQLIPGPVKEKERVCAHDVIKTKDPTKGLKAFILIRHKRC